MTLLWSRIFVSCLDGVTLGISLRSPVSVTTIESESIFYNTINLSKPLSFKFNRVDVFVLPEFATFWQERYLI